MNAVDGSAVKISHPWASDILLRKAQRYAEEMLTHTRDEWRFALLSTFVLEFIGRAALAKVSPTLLAESKDWNNLYFALGFTPNTKKFIPRSINISAVFDRLQVILPSFTPELQGFATVHLNRRNEELHTGGTPLDGIETTWLSSYYHTCEVLLTSMCEDLTSVFGGSETKFAKKLITAAANKSAKTVHKTINAHKTAWQSKTPEETAILASQASHWAMRQSGHRVSCPACNSDALLTGAPISAPQLKLDADENLIVEKQEFLPAKFECIACQLKIAGYSHLNACGLGMTYTATSTYDAAEYYAPPEEQGSAWLGYEEDNNE
jgi:hypothetical protein